MNLPYGMDFDYTMLIGPAPASRQGDGRAHAGSICGNKETAESAPHNEQEDTVKKTGGHGLGFKSQTISRKQWLQGLVIQAIFSIIS